MRNRVLSILVLVILFAGASAQQVDLYPYYPVEFKSSEWKGRVDVYGSEASGSNTFTNQFFDEVTGSSYLSPENKNDQIQKFNGDIITGTKRSIGAGVFLKTKKLFYYVGVENQYVLDTRINEQLVELMLLGNKPFAGEELDLGSSDYSSTYFNRVAVGVGYEMEKNDSKHTFFGKAAFTSGQNHEDIQMENGSFYTHPDGDYLDVAIKAETRIGDTVWADVFTINGLGFSMDLSYALQKKKDYYLGLRIKNMGFVTWNKNPYAAKVDTAFRFEGISGGDTTSNSQEVPDDYSYRNLRDLIFTNPDDSPFNTTLPIIINLSGGKYFSEGKYYAGLNFNYYPTLIASYHIELFGTWNYRDKFQLTPLFSYTSFDRFNVGLSASVRITENIFLQAGSAFLDSYLNRDSKLASGGFIRATVVW